MAQSKQSYSYVFAGGGMAALSLVYQLTKTNLRHAEMLIIDQDIKQKNDKTWCYWSDEADAFESVYEKEWGKIGLASKIEGHWTLEIAPYKYHKIRSEDWYKFIKNELKSFKNIHFLQADITEIRYAGLGTMVHTSKGQFLATQKVFDSISPFPIELENPDHVKQHFLGWYIESNFPSFKQPDVATLFDFRVGNGNEVEFMYFLPSNSHTALVEHTFFSGKLRDKTYYQEKIAAYLQAFHDLGKDDYRIIEEEQGCIPMREWAPKQNIGQKWIKIGTAAGFIKSSTGYSFYRTQWLSKRIAYLLENPNENLALDPKSASKSWMDRVFLAVLNDERVNGNEVLEQLFKKNHPALVLKFLNEESHWLEDFKIMSSVPLWPFLRAAFKNIWKKG